MLPAQVRRLHASLMLAQHANDLILGKSDSPHRSSPSDKLTYQWHNFRGAGHNYHIARYRARENAIVIKRVVAAGTPTIIGSLPYTPAANGLCTIQSEIVGSAPPHMKLFVDGVLVVDKDDPTSLPFTTGSAGPNWNGGTGFTSNAGAQLDTLVVAGA